MCAARGPSYFKTRGSRGQSVPLPSSRAGRCGRSGAGSGCAAGDAPDHPPVGEADLVPPTSPLAPGGGQLAGPSLPSPPRARGAAGISVRRAKAEPGRGRAERTGALAARPGGRGAASEPCPAPPPEPRGSPAPTPPARAGDGSHPKALPPARRGFVDGVLDTEPGWFWGLSGFWWCLI